MPKADEGPIADEGQMRGAPVQTNTTRRHRSRPRSRLTLGRTDSRPRRFGTIDCPLEALKPPPDVNIWICRINATLPDIDVWALDIDAWLPDINV